MKEQKLTAIVQQAAQGSDVGMKFLAAELDKRPSTLYQKLNPYDENGLLGIEDAHHIMLTVEDLSLVRAMAADFGCRVVPTEAAPDGENMHHEKLQAFEAVAAFVKAEDDSVPSKNLRPLLDRAIKELEDVWARRRQEEQGVTPIRQAG